MRRFRLAVAATAAVPLVALAAPAATAAPALAGHSTTSAASVPSATGAATQKVIVLLKDQHPTLPATRSGAGRRAQALRADQSPIIASLARAKAKAVKTYGTLNAVAATVSPAEATDLRSDPAVASVIPDSTISLASPSAAARQAVASAGGTSNSNPGMTCSTDASKPQLNPQALPDTYTQSDDPAAKTARSLGITGKGVTVAWIADGIDINNPEFIRPDGTKVFTDYKDFSGEGLDAPTTAGEAFLDAGSIAAQGNKTYDVGNFSGLSESNHCYIKIEGVAPGASMVGLKVFGEQDLALTSDFLQAIDYAVSQDHVDVLNESFGGNPFPDTAADAIRMFDEQAVAAGTTVTVSSGDSGVTNTLGSPTTDPDVISVGASTTYRVNLQTGYGGARLGQGATGYLNDNISSLSSGGFAEDGHVADLVAPGELNWAPCTADLTLYQECSNYRGKASDVQVSGGTSESAPLTAGAAALVIEAYGKTHGGAKPTPAEIKSILISTANDISAPGDQQGSGLLDTYKAVEAAEAAPATNSSGVSTALPASVNGTLGDGTPVAGSTTVTTDTNQVHESAAPGASVSKTIQLTNAGAEKEKLALSARTLGAYTLDPANTGTVTLSDSGTKAPDYISGVTDNVSKVTFTVPQGADRLDAAIAFQGAGGPSDFSARVRLTLITPTNQLAAYSLPQGVGNYSDVQVSEPAAGTWTAYVFGHDSSSGGTTGPVLYRFRTAKYESFGSLSTDSLTLKPGATKSFTFTAPTPATPGDQSASIVVDDPQGELGVPHVTTIPVALRSLIEAKGTPVQFTDTLTGGNGRAFFTGQTAYYQIQVGKKQPELNASIKLADNPDNPFYAYLVNPDGQAVGYASNVVPGGLSTTGGIVGKDELGSALHALNPAQGTWDLIVNFAGQVSGTALSQPYTVNVDTAPATVTTKGLPDQAVGIKAGSSKTVKIKVTNTTNSPEAYFVDGRLDTSTTYQLVAPAEAPAQVTLPVTSYTPTFIVPTDTTKITAGVSADGPVTFDAFAEFGGGDPDLVANSNGSNATLSYSADPVAQGAWSINPTEFGPYGPKGAPTEHATASMTATTLAFDQAVSSPTGDLWLSALDPDGTGVSPVIVQPGQSATIPVTIAPTAGKGSVVSGTLYLDDANLVNAFGFVPVGPGATLPNGNQVAAIPYSYKVK